jgi:hypothetical protein
MIVGAFSDICWIAANCAAPAITRTEKAKVSIDVEARLGRDDAEDEREGADDEEEGQRVARAAPECGLGGGGSHGLDLEVVARATGAWRGDANRRGSVRAACVAAISSLGAVCPRIQRRLRPGWRPAPRSDAFPDRWNEARGGTLPGVLAGDLRATGFARV